MILTNLPQKSLKAQSLCPQHKMPGRFTPLLYKTMSSESTLLHKLIDSRKNVYCTCLEWGCFLCNQTTLITDWLVSGREGQEAVSSATLIFA